MSRRVGTRGNDVVARGCRLAGSIKQAVGSQHVDRDTAAQIGVPEVVVTRLGRSTQTRPHTQRSHVEGHRHVGTVLQVEFRGVRSRFGEIDVEGRKIGRQARLDGRPFGRRIDVFGKWIGLAVEIQVHDLLLKTSQQVVAAATIELVQAMAADQSVLTALALQIVIAKVAQQRVATGTTQQRVVTRRGTRSVVVAIDEIVAPVTVQLVVATVAQDRVVVTVTVDRVVVGSALHHVGTRTTMQHVGTRSAEHVVVAALAVQPVVAAAATQRVVAVTTNNRIAWPDQLVATIDHVVAVTRIDRVGSGQTRNHVVAVATVDHVRSRTAGDRVITVASINRRTGCTQRDNVVAMSGVDHVGEVDRAGDRVVAVATFDHDRRQTREDQRVHSAETLSVTQIDRVVSVATTDQDRLDSVGIKYPDTGVRRVNDRATDRCAHQNLHSARLHRILADHDRVVGVRNHRQVAVEEQRGDRQQCPVLENFSGRCLARQPQSARSQTRPGRRLARTLGSTDAPSPLPTTGQAVDP